MPLGVGVKLRSGDSGFFLGDVKWGQDNSHSGFGIVTQTNKIFIVRKEHISAFAEPEESIPARRAKDLLDLVVTVPSWSDELVAECTKPMLVAEISKSSIQSDEKFATAMEVVNNAPVFPAKKVPGSIIKQRMLIEELEIELAAHPVVQSSEQDLVIAALRHASAQKDPIGFVNNPRPIADPEGEREVFAWTMFQSVLRLLEKFDAMDENSRPTDFGRLVGSLSGDNELWAALAIQRNNMKLLNCAELAAVMCGLVTDGYKAKNAYFRYKPSNRVLDIYTELETLSWDVRDAQIEQGIEFPIHLCTEMGGLVESWVNGLSWRELCKDTNMDQGDLCRTFRRTVELLKQIPLAYGVPTELSAAAAEAVKRMNRFPVADAETDPLDPVLQTRVGAGVGFGNFEGTDAVSTEDESERLAFVDSLFDDDEEDKDRVEVDDSTELPGGFDIATLTDNEEENKDAEVNFEEIFKGLQKSSKDGSKINSTEGAKTFARRYSNFVDRKRLGSPDPTQPSVSEILGQDLEDFLNQINDADGK